MNRSYNHVKHFVENSDVVKSNRHWPGAIVSDFDRPQDPKHHVNELDDKQRHTGFDYYEYDMPYFGTSSWIQSSLDRSTTSLNFQEHHDPEHNQARHQAIHSHGRSVTCCSQREPVNFQIRHYPDS